MPRQILPGPKYKHWVPPNAEANPDDYVFPELKTYDITDEEWGAEEPTDKITLHKRKMWILDQALYACLMVMFQKWAGSGFNTAAKQDKALAFVLRNFTFGDIMTNPTGELRADLLVLEYVRRIILSAPTGHYVGK